MQILLIHMCILQNIFKTVVNLLKKPVDSFGCAAIIISSKHMTKEMARYCLKDKFQQLVIQLCEEKRRSKDQERYLWWFQRITSPNMYYGNRL